MRGPQVIWIALCTLLLSAASLGCSREQVPNLQDRYVRRVHPFHPEWKRESAIPPVPQRYPHMVIWEVSNYSPGSTPTPAQQRAADELVERCRAAAAAHGWHDHEKGLSDGFDVSDDQRHYESRENLLDDRVLDCDRPEYLMYYPDPDGTRNLVGFMFYVRTPTERGPQVGGPLTVWHFHRWSKQLCADGIIDVGWAVDGECAQGVATHRSPEMLHVWLIDRPNGPFSTSMYLEDYLEVEGLDALLVAPEGDDLDLFAARLDAATSKLEENDRHLLSQSISYLSFAFGKGLTETGAVRPEAGDDTDPETRGRLGLLRAAQRRGAGMRLRHFVDMAFELDQVRPELWTEYEAAHPSDGTHQGSHH